MGAWYGRVESRWAEQELDQCSLSYFPSAQDLLVDMAWDLDSAAALSAKWATEVLTESGRSSKDQIQEACSSGRSAVLLRSERVQDYACSLDP